ncbi:hypothetical protein BCR42DRAFT_159396 [Absidia repens]|uniref:Uncharacterized protein n=1 Tax=Absidia repens TaxID=90262 RepID=A0A1X2HZZ9_9FUNG|nr:hypothetical protein BCR42DRAFT_159396 [Absidia repens]
MICGKMLLKGLLTCPLNPISDQGKFGKVSLQARFFCPLLTAIFADVTKNIILRWPNKMEETIPQIRPDAIISSLVQLNIGPSLGYGEVKPGDASTSKQSLCIDTMKLAVLSKNAASRNGHPIVSFQVNGFHLVFFVVQELDNHLYTMLEIGRVVVPISLSALHAFVTPKNLCILLREASIFRNWCVPPGRQFNTTTPPVISSQDMKTLLNMADKSRSKARECSIKGLQTHSLYVSIQTIKVKRLYGVNDGLDFADFFGLADLMAWATSGIDTPQSTHHRRRLPFFFRLPRLPNTYSATIHLVDDHSTPLLQELV